MDDLARAKKALKESAGWCKKVERIERDIISLFANEGCSVRQATEILDYTKECLLSVTPVQKPETTGDCS